MAASTLYSQAKQQDSIALRIQAAPPYIAASTVTLDCSATSHHRTKGNAKHFSASGWHPATPNGRTKLGAYLAEVQ